jgi:tetratricopeptide (TPR) repeat protein
LETLREYALEHLEANGEAEGIRRSHAAYFLALAEAAEPEFHGPQQAAWVARLEIEHDNLWAVLDWHEATTDNDTIKLRLASALSWFWLVRGYGNEALKQLTSLLSHSGSEQPTTWRAKALNAAGRFSLTFDTNATAEKYYQESLTISTALDDTLNKAYALRGMGRVAQIQCDLARACSAFEESLALFRMLGDSWAIASTLLDLGCVSTLGGDTRRAKICFEESLAIHRQQGDKQGIASALHKMGALMINQDDGRACALFEESLLLYRELGIAGRIASLLNLLGEIARKQGDYAQAATLYEQSLTIQRELGELRSIAASLHNLAYVALHKNDYDRGAALFAESLGLYRKIGDLNGIVICLAGMACMASAQSHSERAACLFGAHEMLLEVSDMPIDPIDRIEYDRNLAAARAQLDDAAFAAAWTAGRGLTLEQAIAEALNYTGADPTEIAEHGVLSANAHAQRLSNVAWAAGRALPLDQAIAEAHTLIRKPTVLIRKSIELDGLISDAQWQRIESLLPPMSTKQTGRPRMDDRQALTAIFYALETSCGWKALPRSLGAPSTIHDRFRAWRAAGVFERLWRAGLLTDVMAHRLDLNEHEREL